MIAGGIVSVDEQASVGGKREPPEIDTAVAHVASTWTTIRNLGLQTEGDPR